MTMPSFRRTTAYIATSGLVAAGLVVAGTSVKGGATPGPREPAMLIVATHTDDENTLSAIWTANPNVKKVFLWVDRLDPASNSALVKNSAGQLQPIKWNPGEWAPSVPMTEQSRADGYWRGSLLNIQALRAADPSLPVMTFEAPTKHFADDGRDVRTWIDPARGGGIKYGAKASNVTSELTRDAINDVTGNPGKYGLPTNYRWTDLLASNYYNNWPRVGFPTCDTYRNPEHLAVNMSLFRYGFPQFNGYKVTPVCQSYPYGDRKTMNVSPAVKRVGYGKSGSINHYFGWLYRLSVPLAPQTSGVFAERQDYIRSSAKVAG